MNDNTENDKAAGRRFYNTPICIPIFVSDVPAALAAMREAVAAGAGMMELRCDRAAADAISSCLASRPALPNGTPLPIIVTIRPAWEGGEYTGDETARLKLFEAAITGGANYIDIEWVAWRDSAALRRWGAGILPAGAQTNAGKMPAPQDGCKLILSNHDFAGRPADLMERLAAMQAVPEAAILKLVWTANSVADAVEALNLTQPHAAKDSRPLLALAMGEFGQLSRLLGAKFGQPFTFATLPQGKGSAPGQPSIADLRATYRWNEQRLDGKVFGVVGWPIGHSLSPAIHNAGLAQCGINAVYVPLPVRPSYEEFKAAVDALRGCPDMNLGGLSVTIPHKENALRYVRENGGTVDELSAHIGVINTIVFRTDGTLYGLNSDYAGALDALADALKIKREGLAGQRVAVIGSGGAARAVVAGLAAYGATVVIYNRNLERAKALAADFDGKTGKVVAAAFDKLPNSCCQIFINATPLGMYPHIEGCPIDFDPAWDAQTTVFDTVYNPLQTRLLQLAARKGARTVTGLEMFVRQAATQFEHFTGHTAPIETFRTVMLARLEQ